MNPAHGSAEPASAEVIALSSRRPQQASPRPQAASRPRCEEPTSSGGRCRNYAGPDGRCRIHSTTTAPPPPAPPEPSAEAIADAAAGVEAALDFLRRRLSGDYHIDVYGFDRELTEEVLMPLARPLYRHWWRVRATGLENVPADSGALVVANHAGTLPFDAVMTKYALFEEHPAKRHLRELAADLALRSPMVGPLARKAGNTLAQNDDARRLLEAGELVGVWPEGFKGIGKPYRDRYKLQRFGRGGFVEVALRTGTPIIPVAIVGAEEIYPMIANARFLARLFGFPYFPITWTFPWLGPAGLIPLPSKWVISFGDPIQTAHLGPDAADDPMTVFELTDRVRDTIQQMLYRNLMGRRSVFL